MLRAFVCATLPPLPGVSLGAISRWSSARANWEDGWQLPQVRSVPPTGDIAFVWAGEFPRTVIASTQINVLDRTDYADRLFSARSGVSSVAASPAPCAKPGADLVGKLQTWPNTARVRCRKCCGTSTNVPTIPSRD